MQGRRIEHKDNERCEPGDYYKDPIGEWRGQTPNGLDVWLRNHHVEENEDGTITVVAGPWGSNSILATRGTRDNPHYKEWHGYIRNGNWEEC